MKHLDLRIWTAFFPLLFLSACVGNPAGIGDSALESPPQLERPVASSSPQDSCVDSSALESPTCKFVTVRTEGKFSLGQKEMEGVKADEWNSSGELLRSIISPKNRPEISWHVIEKEYGAKNRHFPSIYDREDHSREFFDFDLNGIYDLRIDTYSGFNHERQLAFQEVVKTYQDQLGGQVSETLQREYDRSLGSNRYEVRVNHYKNGAKPYLFSYSKEQYSTLDDGETIQRIEIQKSLLGAASSQENKHFDRTVNEYDADKNLLKSYREFYECGTTTSACPASSTTSPTAKWELENTYDASGALIGSLSKFDKNPADSAWDSTIRCEYNLDSANNPIQASCEDQAGNSTVLKTEWKRLKDVMRTDS